ncbi:putative lysosomal cobalamin transporter [Xylona heveae TC161]|uniref:Probable lysosomal cobalamin transporter n=1 Tax=Xylona heveae (strain CBS 132557 / TC161) TaxID=1328760 RepID=A0A165JE23_XYLHT|nr:putative lysosomal cobalamin transporter [Xylona heveae TC161]KZF26117.1 putative lysosomal cobalamin transporter [Xylona heveae TC161]
MAAIQTTLIWIAYVVAVVLLMAIASIFVFIYQTPRDRSASVTTVCIFTLSALLATILLLPVDIALVSSTTSSKWGNKKDWATPNRVDNIVYTLKIVYYTLYSLDALLCLIVVPFTYFWYEEYDEVAAEEGNQSFGQRLWGALKYTITFILLVVILFLVGFFVPVARNRKGEHFDLDYFKNLLAENHGERALTFALGLLITIGTFIYILYTGAGTALLPISLIKSAPSISAPTLAANTASELERNRERQRQLEGRNAGRQNGLDAKDRRELEALVREERTLVRRERLAAEASGEGRSWLVRAWVKLEAVFRPVKLLGGVLLVLISVIVWVSMLITGIDKAKNSICKRHCGYVLGHINIFQPINWIFVQSSKVFPVDYIIVALLVLFFFASSVVGIASIGIRFLWVTIFQIRKGHTSPQALLMATVMLTLMGLAINYSLVMMVAPQYATFGPQTFCDKAPRHPGEQPDCTNHRSLIRPCSEVSDNPAAKDVCTPSVVSTFLNRMTLNFPFFGGVDFWAQFAFLGIFLIVFVTALIRTPKINQAQLDQDAEEDEEEGLLASTTRRFGATWQDITGRARRTGGQTNGAGTSNHDDLNSD